MFSHIFISTGHKRQRREVPQVKGPWTPTTPARSYDPGGRGSRLQQLRVLPQLPRSCTTGRPERRGRGARGSAAVAVETPALSVGSLLGLERREGCRRPPPPRLFLGPEVSRRLSAHFLTRKRRQASVGVRVRLWVRSERSVGRGGGGTASRSAGTKRGCGCEGRW